MNRLITILSIPLIFFLSRCSVNYSNINDLPSQVKTSINDAVNHEHRIGVSIALINQRGVHYYHYGKLRSMDTTVMSEKSIFRIGSLSKIFTSLVFANMIANSEVELQSPVNKYLPSEYQIPSSQTNVMRLEHLVTHTSGLPKHLSIFNSPDSLYKAVSEYSYPSPYGNQYLYSNIGMALLGHILELQSKQSLDQLVLERITRPLHMEQTTYSLNPTTQHDLAQGHLELKPLAEVETETTPSNFIYGGLYSSPQDLVKIVSAYLKDTLKLLSSTLEITQQQYNGGKVGFGWKIENFDGIDLFYHGGQEPGYQSFIGFNKKEDLGVVFMTNSQNDDELQNIAIHLLTNGKVPLPNFSLPKELKLAPEHLNKYVGIYKSVDTPEENTFEISVENSNLFCVERSVNGKIIRESVLYAKNETEFYFKEIPVRANFNLENDTHTARLSLFLGKEKLIFNGVR